MSEPSVDRAIRKALRGASQAPPGKCPVTNQLAAYLESRCGTPERVRLEEHFADCRTCQHILALSLAVSESEPDTPRNEIPARRAMLLRIAIPLSTLAAAAIVLGIVAFWQKRNNLPVQTSEFRPVRMSPPAQIPASGPAPAAKESAEPGLRRLEPSGSVPRGSKSGAPFPVTAGKAEKKQASDAAALPKPRREEPAKVAEARPEASRAVQLQDQRIAPGQAIVQNEQAPLQQRAQGAAGEIRGILKTQLSPAASIMNSNVATIAGSSPQSVLAGFKRADPASLNAMPFRKTGEKVFYRWSDYWIDRECADHAEVAVLEAAPAGKDYIELIAQFPDVQELALTNPVLLYWNGKIYLVR